MDSCKTLMFLNNHEALVWEETLALLLSCGYSFHWQKKRCDHWRQGHLPIPIFMSGEVWEDDRKLGEVELALPSELEERLFKRERKLTLTCEPEKLERQQLLAKKWSDLFATTLPLSFGNMETFLGCLKNVNQVKIYALPESLLLTAQTAVKRLLKGFSYCEQLQFHQDKAFTPETLRFEVMDKVYRYIDINTFQTVKSEELLFAFGIIREALTHQFWLIAYGRSLDMEKIQQLFSQDFEDLLLECQEIKGGKFTGDQRIIRLKEHVTLDDLVLEDACQRQVESEILGFFSLEPMYRQARIPFKRGVVLHGEPGTGKTMLAKVLTCTMKETVIWVKAGDIQKISDINRIFRLARLSRPSVIILEDVDFYTGNRTTSPEDSFSVATIMSQLDGLEENEGVLVLMTTNRLEHIEKAIIERPGRIDCKIFMGQLGEEKITQLLQKKLQGFKTEFTSIAECIPANMPMTGASVVEMATEIMKIAIRDAATSEIIIKREHVQKAFKDYARMENRRRAGFGK